jgi:hypothetical protein
MNPALQNLQKEVELAEAAAGVECMKALAGIAEVLTNLQERRALPINEAERGAKPQADIQHDAVAAMHMELVGLIGALKDSLSAKKHITLISERGKLIGAEVVSGE